MEYKDFLIWGQKREPLLKDDWLSKETFDYALHSSQAIKSYLSLINYIGYVYNYALHLIILTDSGDNELNKKYFPNGNKAGVGMIIGSVSDSTSSYSTSSYKSLQDMTFEEALNAETPYGMFCNTILNSLNNAIVVV